MQCLPDDPDTIVNIGCCLFKEGKYEEARVKFSEAQQALGAGHADLAYNISLCYYRLKQYGKVLQHIAEIIETVTNLPMPRSRPDLTYNMVSPSQPLVPTLTPTWGLPWAVAAAGRARAPRALGRLERGGDRGTIRRQLADAARDRADRGVQPQSRHRVCDQELCGGEGGSGGYASEVLAAPCTS